MALSATNIQPWINNLSSAMNSTNQKQIDAINAGYQQEKNAENATFGNSYKQAEQTLNQIPSNYNGLRNSADITKNQALSWLPQGLANSGAATDSGANYQARTNVGNTYQNTMNSIGQEQNKAQQQQQNAINTLGVTHASNLAKLNSDYQSSLASTLASQRQTIVSEALSAYNEDQNRAEQANESSASLGEQKREYDSTQAEKKWEYQQGQAAQQKSDAASSAKAYQTLYNNTYAGALKYAMPQTQKSADGTSSETLYHVENPTALMSYLANSGLSSSDIWKVLGSIPYHTSTGQTMQQWWNSQYATPQTNGSLDGTGTGNGRYVTRY